jgi:hypothetical protein
MAFGGIIGKALGLGKTTQVLGSILTGGAISPFKSAQANESAPQNVQQTLELQTSGSEGYSRPYTVAADTGLPDRLRMSPRVFDRARDLIGGGIGGQVLEGAGNFLFGGGEEVCTTSNAMKPFSVNKMSGCITVSRKQQAKLKMMVGIAGLEATANALGLDTDTLVLLLLKRFKARGRGITPASMRTTKRTIRQIKSLHNEVSSMAARRAPARRTSTTKTSIVKA